MRLTMCLPPLDISLFFVISFLLLVSDDVVAVGKSVESMSTSLSSPSHSSSSSSPSAPSKTMNLRGNYVIERSIEQAQRKNGWRSLTGPPTLVTPRCNVIRMEAYQAELQLVYSYFVEFASGKARNLAGIEQAITYAVAQELDECDEFDRPRYKIKTNTKHIFSKEQFCPPKEKKSSCHVVTGATAILLDSQFSDVQEETYYVIEKALNDTIYLEQFADNIVRAEFMKPLRQSLVLSPPPDSPGRSGSAPGPVTATVAVAAASVSFVVASVFCYGLLRREHRNHSEPHIRHRNRRHHSSLRNARMQVGNPIDVSKLSNNGRGRHFVRLEDIRLEDLPEPPQNDFMAGTSPTEFMSSAYSSSPPIREATPSIMWSISDITSDCSSILSTLSRNTSKLERIEEEVEEEEVGDEDYEEDVEFGDEGYDEDVESGSDSSSLDRQRDIHEAQPVMEYDRYLDVQDESCQRKKLEEFDGGDVPERSKMEISDLDATKEKSMESGQSDLRRVVTDDVDDEMEEEEADMISPGDDDENSRGIRDDTMLEGSMERSRIKLESVVEQEPEDSVLAVSDEEVESQANSSSSELDLDMSVLDPEDSIDLSSNALIVTEGSSLTDYETDDEVNDKFHSPNGLNGHTKAGPEDFKNTYATIPLVGIQSHGVISKDNNDDNESLDKYGTPRQDEDDVSTSTVCSEVNKSDYLDEWVSHILEDSANLGRIESSDMM